MKRILIVSDCRFQAGAKALDTVDYDTVSTLSIRTGLVISASEHVTISNMNEIEHRCHGTQFDVILIDNRLDVERVKQEVSHCVSGPVEEGPESPEWWKIEAC